MNARDRGALELARLVADPAPAADLDEWRRQRLWRFVLEHAGTREQAVRHLARDGDRLLILLLHEAGASAAVIADALGRTPHSVEAVVSRARSRNRESPVVTLGS